jgi:hypothetical protein
MYEQCRDLRDRIRKLEARSSTDDGVSRLIATDKYGRCTVGGKAFDSAQLAIEYVQSLHPGLDDSTPWIVLRENVPELNPLEYK